MKNNKGFTLVELLAVIVILALITTIAVPAALSISGKIKDNLYCEKIDMILSSAKMYGEDNRDLLLSTTESSPKKIKVGDLVGKYLKKDQDVVGKYIEDPRSDAFLDNDVVSIYLKYDRVYAEYNYPTTNDANICK